MKTFSRWNLDEIKQTFDGKVIALVPICSASVFATGVAVANEPGYNPIPVTWCNIDYGDGAHEEISAYLDTLNQDELGLSKETATKIVLGTMWPPGAVQ